MQFWTTLPLHRDDLKFFESLTHHAPSDVLLLLRFEYIRAWKAAAAAEPYSHRKDNAGRFAANTMIREDSENMRARDPETLAKYKKLLEQGPPRICCTCEHYDQNGHCEKLKADPPHDFAQSKCCDNWEPVIPF